MEGEQSHLPQLKQDNSLNALTDSEVSTLWLSLVIYTNTDQKETTRLGMGWEWSTSITITREGQFQRSGLEDIDETDILTGDENRLTMRQSYTHKF